MVEKQVEVKLKSGLQARQAALFVQEANRYKADVFLEKGAKKVNAKSIMGIMSLAVAKGRLQRFQNRGLHYLSKTRRVLAIAYCSY